MEVYEVTFGSRYMIWIEDKAASANGNLERSSRNDSRQSY